MQPKPCCDDPECCELICGIDPFCCDIVWDKICANEALTLCRSITCPAGCGPLPCCGNPETGSCCFDDGTPCCDDIRCCVTVCGVDPFCCDIHWDQVCIDESCNLCQFVDCCSTACGIGVPPACGPGAGDCFIANGTPGCDDCECCALVCSTDPFCRDAAWDSGCASLARLICGSVKCCGLPGTGNCCVADGTPCCEGAACCEIVCRHDPFCCDTAWDEICVDEAHRFCGEPCGLEANDHCASATPLTLPPGGKVSIAGTSNFASHDAVPGCPGIPPVAGIGVWYSLIGTGNSITASTCGAADFDTVLTVICGGCPPSLCCFAYGGPGCDDPACEATVCAVDPFCCEAAWDEICAGEAQDLCGSLCSEGGDATCVAGNDNSCGLQSQVTWCAQFGAEYLILVHGYAGAVGTFTLTVSDTVTPCAPNVSCPFSCFTPIDETITCIGAKGDFNFEVVGINTCTGGLISFNFAASGGDPDEPMCFEIKLFDNNGDPCCNATVCATVPDCTPSSGPCDLDGDQAIGATDMLILLGAWGSDPGGPPDYDGDGTVAVTDFLHLLAAWGPC